MNNYSTLETFFAKASEKYKQNFPEKEKVQRITYGTSVQEMEEIMTQGVERKYKSMDEVLRDEFGWKETNTKKSV